MDIQTEKKKIIQNLKDIPELKNRMLKTIIKHPITDDNGNTQEIILITSSYTKSCKKYYENNKEQLKEKHREYEKQRYYTDPQFREMKKQSALKTQRKKAEQKKQEKLLKKQEQKDLCEKEKKEKNKAYQKNYYAEKKMFLEECKRLYSIDI